MRSVWRLFEGKERRRLVALFGGMLVVALLETLGVASIMPLLALVANPGAIESGTFTAELRARLGFADVTTFTVFVGVVVLSLIVLTNALSACTSWASLRLVWSKHHALSRQLLAKYLAAPYSHFLERNTSDLSKNILGEVHSVTVGVVIPLLNATARAVVAVAIIVLLVVVDARIAFAVAVLLGGGYTAAYLAVRGLQARIGRERLESNSVRYRLAAEALGGIKDVKAFGCEAYFLRRFATASQLFSDSLSRHQVVATIPRYVLETLAFGGMVAVVLLLLLLQRDIAPVLPVLGLYAIAAYRIVPGLQQIFAGLTAVRYNRSALDVLWADLNWPCETALLSEVATHSSKIDLRREVRIEGLTYTYPGAPQPAINNVSLTIPRRSCIALVGTTGSGKTTLVDLLLGLLRPQHGSVSVDGNRLTDDSLTAWRRTIGYVPQNIFLTDETIRQNIAFGVPLSEVDGRAVERAARAADLHDFIDTLPLRYDTPIGERGVRLSGGQRQRLGIARALYREPAVLILDEATSALDNVTEAAVLGALRARTDVTFVMIAHRLSSVRECDRIYVLEGGEILDHGAYEDLRGTHASFRMVASSVGRAAGEGRMGHKQLYGAS